MSQKFIEKRIILSASEPPKEALWLHPTSTGMELMYYGPTGWTVLVDNNTNDT